VSNTSTSQFLHRERVTPAFPSRPSDATLSVTKAARLLGVHPNTIRSWSDQGRLRYYRINPRGDRRYRLGDLQGFLAAAEAGALAVEQEADGRRADDRQPGLMGRSALVALPGGRNRRPDRPRRIGRVYPSQSPAPLAGERHRLDLRVLGQLIGFAADGRDLDLMLQPAVALLREAYGYHAVAAYEHRDGSLMLRSAASPPHARPIERTTGSGTPDRAIADQRPILARRGDADWLPLVAGSIAELAVPIVAGRNVWGVLVVAADDLTTLSIDDVELLEAIAGQFGAVVYSAGLLRDASLQVHRLDALRRVAGDIGGRLDLDQTLSGLIDHATVLFEADRAALFLRRPDGQIVAEIARGLSPTYLASVRDFPRNSLPAAAVAARRPLSAIGYAEDPRGGGVRAAVIQEGYDTLCTAPLFDGSELLGLLNVYHDRPHNWSADEMDTIAAFAAQASVAIKTARNYSQMATWAAQLQSIQQLGARLNRLSSVKEIGMAIATELRQLLDFHNVRVYRLYGHELVPVAMQGQVGEYIDETPEQLKVEMGEGITGWVAQHKLPQNLPDAANDPRANTIAGTEEDLDESMLLAPMVFDDRVLGVLVLSKLGLSQFTDDDLRLLVIYGSFAAQAMANADATEALRGQSASLERQLRSQRDLLQITESILTTLDSRAVLDQITDRLGALVRCDNIAIELLDQKTGVLRPLTAKGIHADDYMQPWEPGEEGIATWVVAHNEPQLVVDERDDPRINWFRSTGQIDGSLIVVPLRGRDGATGVLTLERLGTEHRFMNEEFELVKLFAAQVSIALQNAEAHRVLAVRARTDALTGLLNHGTFQDWLSKSVAHDDPFSLIMIDLDGFKRVNDALGHQAGDRLLHEIAAAIVAAGRDSDLVFRYGGDEFAVLLPGSERIGGTHVADRIRAAVHAVGAPGTPWHLDKIEVSASIGLASFPEDGDSAEAMLLAADRACFVAKRSGHGLVATAAQGRALAAEFSLQAPTPVDPPSLSV
jgi:diguanylate cyclase (GGDEF)-like protein/excisionase family DNA binding protein